MGHLDWLMPNQASPSFTVTFCAEIEPKSSVLFFWQPVTTQARSSNGNKRRVAELNHQAAEIKIRDPLCNLPRQLRFWPTLCVWIQSFPWWIFCLIKAIWHKFAFNQCLAPVQCIGHQPNWTHTWIKKPDRGNQIGLDQKHGRLLIGCLTGMENYHRLKRAAQMPLIRQMRSRIALWTQPNTMTEQLCCQAHRSIIKFLRLSISKKSVSDPLGEIKLWMFLDRDHLSACDEFDAVSVFFWTYKGR